MYLLCRFGGFFGELPDLLGDDGESPSGLSGPGGLDGGIEGQEIRLVGDVGNGLRHADDLVHAFGDFREGVIDLFGHAVEGVDGFLTLVCEADPFVSDFELLGVPFLEAFDQLHA